MATRRTPAAKFEDIPGELPESSISQDVDFANVAKITVDLLNRLKQEHLTDNALWRDFVAFTDTFRTFHSNDTVFSTFQKLSQQKNCSTFSLGKTDPRLATYGPSSWLDIDVNFTLQDGDLVENCAGTISVLPNSAGDWKIWLIRTWLENYEGHGDPDQLETTSQNGHDQGLADEVAKGSHGQVYDVIIAGGGQGGLSVAGRLKALGVNYKLFDNRANIGDSWGDRYDSLKWHTIREYGNLPFGSTWSPEDDNLLPKNRICAGHRTWSEKYGIDAQTATNVDSAKWDEKSLIWTVYTSGPMGKEDWKTKDLVLCMGPGHKTPISPDWATPEKIKASGFKGTIVHSANYRNADAFTGKRGVVIGTANTAHDVAEDMANVGMHTTMVQRNPTFIFPGEWLVAFQSHDYHLNKPNGMADREQVTMPYKIQRELANRVIWGLIDKFPERFDALEKAGFKVDRHGDLLNHLVNRLGGHYLDIGSCARIAKGEIKVKAQLVQELKEDGLLFQDGTTVGADLIVVCTGFEHDNQRDAAEVVGQDIAEQMDDLMGMDAEGELRGFAKLAGHPHLFYFGGEARLSRFISRFLALQLQKRKLGQPLQPYQGK